MNPGILCGWILAEGVDPPSPLVKGGARDSDSLVKGGARDSDSLVKGEARDSDSLVKGEARDSDSLFATEGARDSDYSCYSSPLHKAGLIHCDERKMRAGRS
jgi:hypothetical protein